MKETTKQEIYSWIKSILFAFSIAFICRHFLFTPVEVHGESMSPTFADKDKLMVTKISELQRFDMIVFDAPDSEENYVKRVIGLPGDEIEVKDDVLYINGKVYDEPYLKENKQAALTSKLTGDFSLTEVTGKAVVPKGFLFVMGDNRLYSKDSRMLGFISEKAVLGEVKFRFYPLQHIGTPK